MMKKILAFFLLAGMSLSTTFADLVEINSSSDSDPIDALTRAIAQGSYGDSNASIGSSDVDDVSGSPQIVSPQDYKKLNIKRLYGDSVVRYHPNNNKYIESKIFNNNIMMIYSASENYAEFSDLDSDNAPWRVFCKVDHITDEKYCSIAKFEFIFIKSSKDGVLLSIASDKQNTFKYQYLRIDKNPVFKTKLYFKGQTVVNIIGQMKRGETAYTRFYEWADIGEETISLSGFSVAYETMNLMYSKLK